MIDKKTLQTEILEAPYQPEKWRDVLIRYFGAKKFHQLPQIIPISDNELATEAVELGSFYTADERLIGIYEVKLTPQIWISKNRVGLRNLLRQVYQYDVDGALIVFVQEDKWRFSYISEIRTLDEKKQTEPKRYTYLFGKGESCRTAADRFDKLKDKPIYLNDLYEAFSVEKLNKDFFKTYKAFYEKFWQYLAKNTEYYQQLIDNRQTDEDKKQKPIRDFAKKLLGRMVFLQFLQKKGWLGVSASRKDWKNGDMKFLQSLFRSHPQPEKFHSTALKTLFFETLNIKRENDIAPASLGIAIKLPYLNGGLFDQDSAFIYKIDFPADYFANLLDFFEQYNFTIDENDPYDSEIGIDPEMLGHIFENLLEENREKGTFYTPKEIVHFLCQESLIEYLHTQLPLENKEVFELLIRNNQVHASITAYKKANIINDKLKAVKICDPTIGSGAFPMGLLKEIFECRRLLYPYLRNHTIFDPIAVKKEIIQKNIYGVDLEYGAVEIARLRFWLTLVVDEDEPQPLPNLDFKIMQGNSLLERFGTVKLEDLAKKTENAVEERQPSLGIGFEAEKPLEAFSQDSKEQLDKLIDKYFDPDKLEKDTGEKLDKSEAKKQINQFVEKKIHAFIQACQDDLTYKIKAVERKWESLGINVKNKDFTKLNQKSKEFKQYLDWQKQLAGLDETEQKLLVLQKTEDKPYFLWHLWFKNVFKEGGFDIVIGNPPYRQLQKMTEEIHILQELGYETFTRMGDLYCLFYEKGLSLLKYNGILAFITSNKWMRAAYGESLRQYFIKHSNPLILIDFGGFQVFDSATVDTNIFIGQKAEFQNKVKTCVFGKDFSLKNMSDFFQQHSTLNTHFNTPNSWIVVDEIEKQIKEKIEKIGTPLREWDINIYRGVLTGYNEAFIIDSATRDKLISVSPNSAEIIRPILRGRDIKRYGHEWQGLYIIGTLPSLRVDIEKYPAVKEHLLSFGRERLEQTGKQYKVDGKIIKSRKITNYQWFETQDSISYWEDFFKPKIIYPEIVREPQFSYDTNSIFINDTCFVMVGQNLKYILALLNSRPVSYFFKKFYAGGGLGEDGYRYKKVFLENLPLPKPDNQLEDKINHLVDEIHKQKEDNRETLYIENELDTLIFNLYSLTEEEIQIIIK
ncbi:Eco57I restriction endonuclease [Beggiatoa alba B18LD]|uniref:site-specific DNA-methyltransferase (adenine-specific) n=1 Tax=Beggiatoa alba B18LD TaxID=395493 RepID=I3CKG3_9GAMM|nr:TaqI-like C-terminal specificity domain-containing protein [Beggiatoa alba]EIJ44106.1 Eco57I restriction endonuclease [Beggiatoa alba B18LD]